MAGLIDELYSISPPWLQNMGVSLYGLYWKHRRYGGGFKGYVADFTRRESFNREEWETYQGDCLRQLLQYAYKHVPYYHALFVRLGIDELDLDCFTLSHLQKLPLLSKEILRRQQEDFLSVDLDEKPATYLTSGTTGTPLAIKFTREGDRLAQAAYEARVRNWAGLGYQMSRAMIGGRMVVPKANAESPFWRYNIFERQLYMSAFHISPQNAPYYAKALNQYRPDYLVGYASSHFFLARMLEELGIEMYSPKAILTSSEKLTSDMRGILEKVYRCEVFDAYSSVEACCQASECEYHNMHISPDMGLIEFLDEDDQPVPPGIPGRMIATGFLNFAQPLIRYDTGDIGICSEDECPCGRQMPLIKELVGRLEDTVVGRDGRETVRFHGIFIGLENVREGQIIQEELDRFTIRLVVLPDFGKSDKEIIYDRFQQRLGEIKLDYEFVDKIERTKAGKFKAVISHVKRNSVEKPHLSE